MEIIQEYKQAVINGYSPYYLLNDVAKELNKLPESCQQVSGSQFPGGSFGSPNPYESSRVYQEDGTIISPDAGVGCDGSGCYSFSD